jgi:phage shock protein E
MGFFSKLFGGGQPKVSLADLIQEGATILDVRTKNEYREGHIKGSLNIPLNDLAANLNKINKNKPVITCCASGMRSGAAKTLLKNKGFERVENGGSWLRLKSYF